MRHRGVNERFVTGYSVPPLGPIKTTAIVGATHVGSSSFKMVAEFLKSRRYKSVNSSAQIKCTNHRSISINVLGRCPNGDESACRI